MLNEDEVVEETVLEESEEDVLEESEEDVLELTLEEAQSNYSLAKDELDKARKALTKAGTMNAKKQVDLASCVKGLHNSINLQASKKAEIAKKIAEVMKSA